MTLIFTMLHLRKKIKKNTCRYHYQNLDDRNYSYCHFLPFYPPKNPKNQNFQKWKNLMEISSFYTYIKITIYYVQFLRYGVRQTESFVIMGHFLSFYHPLTTSLIIPKINILGKKWKKCLEILSFYTYMCTISHKWRSYDIWFLKYKVRQRHLRHFGPFFAFIIIRYYHFTHVYHKLQSYDVWFLRYGAWQTECFVILDRFLPFYPPNNSKNQNFEKVKKTPGDIIILCKFTINDSHMMFGFWEIKRDRHNFFVILDYFLAFYYPNNQENKILKN